MAKPEKTDGFSFVFHATKITAGEIKASFGIPVKLPLSPPLSLQKLTMKTRDV